MFSGLCSRVVISGVALGLRISACRIGVMARSLRAWTQMYVQSS